jgi:hypothetical protein
MPTPDVPYIEGIVDFANSPRCKKTAMIDFKVDLPTTNMSCIVCSDDDATKRCSTLLPSITGSAKSNVNFIKYEYIAESATGEPKMRVLEFRGNIQDVYATLELVKYKPEPRQNHWLLKSRYVSASTAKKMPFEKMKIGLYLQNPATSGTLALVSEIRQIMNIKDVNNAPTLKNPTDTYSKPQLCLSDPLVTRQDCHFGQFFRFEDTFQTLKIVGVQVSDTDLLESCTFNFPVCNKIDCSVATLMGSTGLNTRVALNVYQDFRSALGFGSYLPAVNNAIQVLEYRVELQELAGTKTSTILNYNTQHSGNLEYITVTVSDQGNTGAQGVSEIATTKIPVTIVAVNDDPVIVSETLEYGLSEDTFSDLGGNVILDIDLEETTVSSLADMDWLEAAENVNLVNQITLTVSVTRGTLYSKYLRNIQLNMTKKNAYMTVLPYRANFPNADFCYFLREEKLGTASFSKHGAGSFRSVCSLVNIGTDKCPTGNEADCLCDSVYSALSCQPILLVLNRSRPAHASWRQATISHVASRERTCGGIPIMKPPNNFSFAKDCSDCLSGKPCKTCASKNLLKCEMFDMKYMTGPNFWDPAIDKERYNGEGLLMDARWGSDAGMYPEHCSNGKKDDGTSQGFNYQKNPDIDTPIYRNYSETGVDKGGECWPSLPARACRCCANILQTCTQNSDCKLFWDFASDESPCGCSPGAPFMPSVGNAFAAPAVCGPYRSITGEAEAALHKTKVVGTPCTYAGPGAEICRASMYVADGTNSIDRIERLGKGLDGSNLISIFGPLPDVNRFLLNLVYRAALNYNRLYRTPKEERDPTTFSITKDDIDQLVIVADDNGNSGGALRDVRRATKMINMRIEAVNDFPEIDAPLLVRAVEDVRYYFGPDKLPTAGQTWPIIQCPEPEPRVAIYGTLSYKCLPVQIMDPDFLDYGSDVKPYLLTMYADHGSLFLDEKFLQTAMLRQQNQPVPKGEKSICDGDAQVCQKSPAQDECCKCNSFLPGCNIRFHQSGAAWWLQNKQRPRGLHNLDGPEWNVGNQFLAIEGTFSEINRALLGLSYLSHPNFNTRSGVTEKITIEIDDQGNMGANYFTTRHLKAKKEITVVVDSVNDPPQVGRLLPVITMEPGITSLDAPISVPSLVLFPIDVSLNVRDQCFVMDVTSAEYARLCSPMPLDMFEKDKIVEQSYRRYIDIDENTMFEIRPDVLWIEDVDSDEALDMVLPAPWGRRYDCTGESVAQAFKDRGCFCGKPCRCDGLECECGEPSICFDNMTPNPGELIVELSVGVGSGYLSLYPPPGRSFIDGITFLTNRTLDSVEDCVQSKESKKLMSQDYFSLDVCVKPCPDKVACMRNQSRLILRVFRKSIQEAISKGYLIYSSTEDGNGAGGGPDNIHIYVSDQGMTSDSYLSNIALVKQAARANLPVRIVAVNDAPVIEYPKGLSQYNKADRCIHDIFMNNPNNCNFAQDKLLPRPPAASATDSAQTSGQYTSMFIHDWDADDVAYGNITLTMRIGKRNAGRFQFLRDGARLITKDLSYLQFKDDQNLRVLALSGARRSINAALAFLRYNSDPTFLGLLSSFSFTLSTFPRLGLLHVKYSIFR